MSQSAAASGDEPVTREYLDLRLEAEFSKIRAEIAEGFARSQRWLVGVVLTLLVPLLATLVAALVR